MMEHTLCIPCVYGDHDGHQEVIETPPPGMLGGKRCPCESECRATSTSQLVCCECGQPLGSPGCQLNSGIGEPYHHHGVPALGTDVRQGPIVASSLPSRGRASNPDAPSDRALTRTVQRAD